MNAFDDLDRTVGKWIHEVGTAGRPVYLPDILERTRRTRQRPAWTLWPVIVRDRAAVIPAHITPTRAWALAVVMLLLLALVAILAGVGAGRRLPPPIGPARNGAIVYDVGGTLYRAAPDGSDPRPLMGASVFVHAPAWSPDGTRLAYAEAPSYAAVADSTLAIVDVDAGSTIRVPLPAQAKVAGGMYPAWSPDGRSLAFCADSAGVWPSIFVVGSDGTGLRRIDLKAFALNASLPTWSPDGSEIAFPGQQSAGTDGPSTIWAVSADGTNPRRISATEATVPSRPKWSPDGRQVAFMAPDWATGHVYLVNRDGTNEHRLIAGTTPDGPAAWSPDGTRLAILRVTTVATDPAASVGRVALVRPDGTAARELDSPDLEIHTPVWSPDGTKLLAYLPPVAGASGGYVRQAVLLDVAGGPPVILPALDGRADVPSDYAGIHTWQRLAP
jgi:dipeptidyl aminopeptidase/acylaminoacyl peptidase